MSWKAIDPRKVWVTEKEKRMFMKVLTIVLLGDFRKAIEYHEEWSNIAKDLVTRKEKGAVMEISVMLWAVTSRKPFIIIKGV